MIHMLVGLFLTTSKSALEENDQFVIYFI